MRRMSHLDELDEYEAELELRLKKEYTAVFGAICPPSGANANAGAESSKAVPVAAETVNRAVGGRAAPSMCVSCQIAPAAMSAQMTAALHGTS